MRRSSFRQLLRDLTETVPPRSSMISADSHEGRKLGQCKRYRNSLLQTQYFKRLFIGSHLLSQRPLWAELCKTVMELRYECFNTWCQHFSHIDYTRKHYAESRAPEKLIFTFQIQFINEDLVCMHCSTFIKLDLLSKIKAPKTQKQFRFVLCLVLTDGVALWVSWRTSELELFEDPAVQMRELYWNM